MASITLHRAPWVVPVAGAVIENGAVAVSGGRIKAVGSFAGLRKRFAGAAVIDHGDSALLPALINAHIHLELSHLPIPLLHGKLSGFTSWIAALLGEREKNGATGAAAEQAARQVMLEQHRLGVIALGDIGNTDLGARLAPEFPGRLIHFYEFLGRTAKTRRKIAGQLAGEPPDRLFTAHAPYSTHPELIVLLKNRARSLNHPFPIHTAEPPSENELLSRGTGELHDFLLARGFIDSSYQPPLPIDKPGSVRYLHSLGVLDQGTVCVHCIHVSPEETALLAETGTRVCLCPGSNRYLGAGKAPVGLFLAHGILPALGTDSLASNPQLSIWREMACIRQDHPAVSPADILAMATLGGARALGIDEAFGSLAAGRSSSFLAVPLGRQADTPAELMEELVQEPSLPPVWINEA
jgi:aminodeoxyfutalosine deaminase